MKKILHISKFYYPYRGGTEQIAQDMVNALKGKYEQKIICFNSEKKDTIDIVEGCEVYRCGIEIVISSQPISLSYPKRLKKLILEFNPDAIILHYPNPYVSEFLLKYITSVTKLVVYWHLDIVKQKVLSKLFIHQNNLILRRANILIATSPLYVEGSPYLSKSKNKCVVIPNCINERRLIVTNEVLSEAKRIREKYKEKILCLAVGRHTEYKGFKYLIQASKYLDDRFVICITGKGEETESLKKEAKGDSKVHFLGTIDDVHLCAYLKEMDIFCFPSITKNEAFGVALAEGMYYGKPTVTFTIPGSGVNYVSLNGVTGIEVENRNVQAYAEAMEKLANSPELRKKLGKAARQRVIENFMDKQFRINICKVIDDLF